MTEQSQPVGEPVLIERSRAVATVRLNRPHAMNSLDQVTKAALLAALREVSEDDSVRAVVLAGSGRAFCVGQDLKEHVAGLEAGVDIAQMVREEYSPVVDLLLTMDKPVVAAVNGPAAGAGAGLAFAADLRILSEKASYSLAFTGIGLACDTGISWTLPRLIGMAAAKELLFSPAPLSAEQALAKGLATEVVAPSELDARAAEVAANLASGPTRSYGAIRRALVFATAASLPDALAHEADAMGSTGTTQDHRDAVTAFIAKERPTFHGR